MFTLKLILNGSDVVLVEVEFVGTTLSIGFFFPISSSVDERLNEVLSFGNKLR